MPIAAVPYANTTRKMKQKNCSENTEINWKELMRCTLNTHSHTHCTKKMSAGNVSVPHSSVHCYTKHLKFIAFIQSLVCLFICLLIQCLYFDCTQLTFFIPFRLWQKRISAMRLIVICVCVWHCNKLIYFCKNIFKDLFKMQINIHNQSESERERAQEYEWLEFSLELWIQ